VGKDSKGGGSPKNQETPEKRKITEKKTAPLKITKTWGDKVGLSKPACPSRYQTIQENF
jgi:hypothetical protein